MTLAIVQARMGSKRLPGKALAPLRGQPLIWRQLERLRGAKTLTRVVVATSREPGDDALAAWLVSQGQAVFRGAPSDLLDRFARCAVSAGPCSHVVRIKGDAPFVDPRVIDEAVRMARVSGADYVSNREPASYPRGLEVEVIAGPGPDRRRRRAARDQGPGVAHGLHSRQPGPLQTGQLQPSPRPVGAGLAGQDGGRPGLRPGDLQRLAPDRPGLCHGGRARPGRRPSGPRQAQLRSLMPTNTPRPASP